MIKRSGYKNTKESSGKIPDYHLSIKIGDRMDRFYNCPYMWCDKNKIYLITRREDLKQKSVVKNK